MVFGRKDAIELTVEKKMIKITKALDQKKFFRYNLNTMINLIGSATFIIYDFSQQTTCILSEVDGGVIDAALSMNKNPR